MSFYGALDIKSPCVKYIYPLWFSIVMEIVYSEHARKRMRQRGITSLEVVFVLHHSFRVQKTYNGKQIAIGELNSRTIKVVYIEKEKYLKIITVL